jgi:chromosome segregation ATPase
MADTIAAREAALKEEVRAITTRAAETEKILAVEQEKGKEYQLRIGRVESTLEAERATNLRLQGELDRFRETLTAAETEKAKAVATVERLGLERRIDRLESDLRQKGGGSQKTAKPAPAAPAPAKANRGETQQSSPSQ